MEFNWTDFLRTLGTLMFSLFVTDWLQIFPGFKWLWPKAWEEKWQAQQAGKETRLDTEGHPMTDTTPSSTEMTDMQTQLNRLRSDMTAKEANIKAREDALRTREAACNDREDRLLKREKQLVTKLEALAENLKAQKDALSSCLEGHITRGGEIRRPSSEPHRIMSQSKDPVITRND